MPFPTFGPYMIDLAGTLPKAQQPPRQPQPGDPDYSIMLDPKYEGYQPAPVPPLDPRLQESAMRFFQNLSQRLNPYQMPFAEDFAGGETDPEYINKMQNWAMYHQSDIPKQFIDRRQNAEQAAEADKWLGNAVDAGVNDDLSWFVHDPKSLEIAQRYNGSVPQQNPGYNEWLYDKKNRFAREGANFVADTASIVPGLINYAPYTWYSLKGNTLQSYYNWKGDQEKAKAARDEQVEKGYYGNNAVSHFANNMQGYINRWNQGVQNDKRFQPVWYNDSDFDGVTKWSWTPAYFARNFLVTRNVPLSALGTPAANSVNEAGVTRTQQGMNFAKEFVKNPTEGFKKMNPVNWFKKQEQPQQSQATGTW